MATRVPTYALYGEHDQPLIPESLHVESIAERSRLYDWEIRPHRHDLFAQILSLRTGRGEVVFDDERRPYVAPCVVFVPALTVHGFRFSSDTDGVIVTVVAQRLQALLQAEPALEARLARAQCLSFEPQAPTFVALDEAVRTLTAEAQGHAPWRMTALTAALGMVLVRLGRALEAAGAHGAQPPSRSLQHVQRFRALVEQHYRAQHPLSFYAEQLGITTTQLNRVCREVLRTSALGALHERLLLEAKRDLAYTQLSVKEIAWTLGFADAAYFTRFFTQHTGWPPRRFRELARHQLAGRESRLSGESRPARGAD
ncbi:helix-turn-helix domain-containing protein [Caldimonas sp.]|uniref:helix-turn-helix domain-containing protein n=1 Tax=Caldimonas sp. TaxID=2838790 RepID=UPI0039196384